MDHTKWQIAYTENSVERTTFTDCHKVHQNAWPAKEEEKQQEEEQQKGKLTRINTQFMNGH